MTPSQWLLVAGLLALVATTQFLSFRAYQGLERMTSGFGLAQNITGDLADAQRDALQTSLAIERMAQGASTAAEARQLDGFLGKQLKNLAAQDLPADVRAEVLQALTVQAALAVQLDGLVDKPPADAAAAVPRLRGQANEVETALHGLYARFEVSFYQRTAETLSTRTDTQRWILGVAVLSILLGIGLATSLRRTVRRDFDRAYAVIVEETAERAAAERAARRTDQRFGALVRRSADVIAVVDRRGRLRYHSPSLARIVPGSLLTTRALQLVAGESKREVLDAFAACLAYEGVSVTLDARLVGLPGEEGRLVELTLTNLTADEAVRGVVVNAHDVTERVRHARELEHLAFHDRLTGLPNRIRLERELDRLSADDRAAALVTVDLDRFAAVNRSFGQDVGDAVLGVVAGRMAETPDVSFVAHLGGDEFALLFVGEDDAARALGRAAAVVDALHVPIGVGERSIRLTGTAGVALGRCGDGQGHELLRRADATMHRTKAGGRDSVGLFDADGHQALEVQTALTTRLAAAIAEGGLDLYYQPLVGADGAAVGVEALLRWHCDGAVMSPTEFIAAAEASGLIVPIGRWVIERACRDLRALREAAGNDELYMSLNLSAHQLHDDDLVGHVGFCLSRYGLHPSSLVVELTESAIVDDPAMAATVLAAFRDLGARVAIDDFGTGYSSLAYLRLIPADILKIDRSLVIDLEHDERAEQLLRGIVTLAHDLGMHVTVEGVEDEVQLRLVRAAGCDAVQGYIYSPPRELAAAEAILAMLAPAGAADLDDVGSQAASA